MGVIRRTCAALAVGTALLCMPAAAHAGTWGWAEKDLRAASDLRLLPSSVLKRGPAGTVTRAEFIRALARVERLRARRHGAQRSLVRQRRGARLSDVGRRSLAARSVRLGWLRAIRGSFLPRGTLTTNEAYRGALGVLGQTAQTRRLARRLRRAAPRSSADYTAAATHIGVRSAGLVSDLSSRQDRAEPATTSALPVAHVARLLRRAVNTPPRAAGIPARYRSLRLPRLRANERRIVQRTVELMGTPYVWAGEDERSLESQPSGVGGFDCTGFVLRVLGSAGINPAHVRTVAERSSYDMSGAIPPGQRIRSIKRLRPGDIVFFGSRGRQSAPGENYHAGIYLGNRWFAHSSDGAAGVTWERMDGYWARSFSWGRRVLLRR